MPYAALQMFMEKLKQLINCNDNPFINHPEIIREKPQFQLLHQDLDSMIQTLLIDEHHDTHELEKFDDLKKRFRDAAEEAQYTVDQFLSAVHTRYNVSGVQIWRSIKFVVDLSDIKPSLNLDDVRNSIESFKVELMSTRINNMEFHSSRRAERKLNQSAAAPRISQGSKKIPDEMIIVGIDDDAKLIKDKLMEDRKKLDVVSVVGMGGIGKTTLATKVFNDSYVKYHFHVRVWVTVSQTYDKRHVLIQILESICEKGWELLCKKVLQGNDCPECLIRPGMQIVENCKGLPLAVAVIAGFLEKESLSEKFWVEIAYKTGSYIVDDHNGSIMESLALSYNHLPLHLRECFLYLGGFPEDYKFKVRWLVLLWIAEGFIQEDGNKSLEDIAEGYLMDLIGRNLVTVAHRSNCNGGVKACKVHDLVRELCLRKAKEDGFILQTGRQTSSSHFRNVTTPPYKPVRAFINKDHDILPYMSSQSLRSILCFTDFRLFSFVIANYSFYFVLLRVLDLHTCLLKNFPKGVELLVHLRYPSKGYFILPSIEKPMNLQTFSDVELGDGVDFQTCFPYVKELGCMNTEKNNFKFPTYLEKLNLDSHGIEHIALPATLKVLTLENNRLPWSKMSIIQSLPNLQVLKLHYKAFEGSCWNTDEHRFERLTFLRLECLDIKMWKAYSTSFPCLKQLEIESCKGLEEIPLEIGEIPTLELIKITHCRQSVGEYVERIQEDQRYFGNYDLKIDILEYKWLCKFGADGGSAAATNDPRRRIQNHSNSAILAAATSNWEGPT
ncbi:hypothetical protein E3N88_18766 [Mikania micrantha]|uniref:Uncharacterized protein n=1 Tax=Mikania micrantha TaxID=192012 RepID=A0A5N6NN10_9ASTR|nr:hypothetical protein E3N88_18766 [Mikania micrantha]